MNYQDCTIEELVEHVLSSTVAAITQQLSYYRKKEDLEVVEKILRARILAKQKKLQQQLEGL
jgi:hypothetical protein